MIVGDRRSFLRATVAGAAGVLGARPRPAEAEPPPETTRLRLAKVGAICVAPEYVAEELLRTEGFTDIEYVQKVGTIGKEKGLVAGDVDLTLHFVAPLVVRVDAGDPIVILTGVHIGCFELFGTQRVRATRDLKGKAVAVLGLGEAEHVFASSMLAHVGVDPRKDVRWVVSRPVDSIYRLAEESVDAYLAFRPCAQELRARKIGHLVTNIGSTVVAVLLLHAGRSQRARAEPSGRHEAGGSCRAQGGRAVRPGAGSSRPVARRQGIHWARAIGVRSSDAPQSSRREMAGVRCGRHHSLLRLATPRGRHDQVKSAEDHRSGYRTEWRFLNELKKELKA